MDRKHLLQLLREACHDGVFPGACVAVGDTARTEFISYGATAPLSESSQVSETTIYDIASLTKPLATLGALILLERGLFRLDDTVAQFCSEFATEDKAAITLRHLLTHTSGLSAHEPLYLACSSGSDMLRTIASGVLKHPTGSRVEYSCLGYIVLGQILSSLTGVCLDQFLTAEVFEPLAMNCTSFPGTASRYERAVTAPTEYCPWRQRLVWGEVHDENAYAQGGVSGNAGVFSNANDMARLARMYLGRGQLEGRRIVSGATVAIAAEDHTQGLNEARGLGWQKKATRLSWFGDLADRSSYGHTGFTGTSLWISPAQGIFVILLSNRVYPSRLNNAHIRFRALLQNVALASLLLD